MLAARAAYSAGAPLSLPKKAVGKKAQRGDTPLCTPPRRSPACGLLRRNCASLAQQKANPGAYKESVVLPCKTGDPNFGKSVATEQTQSLHPQMGWPPLKGRPFGGEWRGEREVPLSAFSFPGFFSAKRNRALPAQGARPARTKTPAVAAAHTNSPGWAGSIFFSCHLPLLRA